MEIQFVDAMMMSGSEECRLPIANCRLHLFLTPLTIEFGHCIHAVAAFLMPYFCDGLVRSITCAAATGIRSCVVRMRTG